MPDVPIYKDPALRVRIILMLGILVSANVVAWILAAVTNAHYPNLRFLWLAGIAYGFGLRHAVDADHICAIDNTTRKLMSEGKRPIGVGLYFSLGHSTVVLLLCALAAFATTYATAHIPAWKEIGDKLGTGISTAFLYLIGAINLIVLITLFRTSRAFDEGDARREQKLEQVLQHQGILGRIFRPILRTISHSWQMYFVGFLFGLGFDTATEVGMLSIAAQQSNTGLSFGALMLLPAMFTLGMCLIDALNGVLMLGAYGWAFVDAKRKLLYNYTIVIVSVTVAFAVATKQLLDMNNIELPLKGRLADLANDKLGFVIVGVFLVGWLVSALIYRYRTQSDRSIPPLEPTG